MWRKWVEIPIVNLRIRVIKSKIIDILDDARRKQG